MTPSNTTGLSPETLARLDSLLKDAYAKLAPGPWSHTRPIGWIKAPSLKGGETHVADVRGWGYLTGGGHGALGLEDDLALAQQKVWGDLIAESITALPALLAAARSAPSPTGVGLEEASDAARLREASPDPENPIHPRGGRDG